MSDDRVTLDNRQAAEKLRELYEAVVAVTSRYDDLQKTFKESLGLKDSSIAFKELAGLLKEQMAIMKTYENAVKMAERIRRQEIDKSMAKTREMLKLQREADQRRVRFARSNEGKAQIAEGRATISNSREEQLTNQRLAVRARLRAAEEKAVGEVTEEILELTIAEKELTEAIERETKARRTLLDLQKRINAANARVDTARQDLKLARDKEERIKALLALKKREIELERQMGDGEETDRLRRLENQYRRLMTVKDSYTERMAKEKAEERAANKVTEDRSRKIAQLSQQMKMLDLQMQMTGDEDRQLALNLEREELKLKKLQLQAEDGVTDELKKQLRFTEELIAAQKEQVFQSSVNRAARRRHDLAGNADYLQSSAAMGNAAWRERLTGQFSGDTFRLQGRLMANFMVLNGLMEAFRFSMRFVVEFDRALYDLQAITASTDTEMDQFRASIVGVANATKFTAVEVAEAAKVLGQAGFTVREVGQALDGVARFASATGITIQEGVDLMSSAISVFGRRAQEATDLANLFTAALNTSKLTQDRLSQSFSYVANTASQSGVAIEELTAVLAGLANAGIRSGSTIGTNLRAMMIALQSPTQKMIDKFTNMGVSMREVDLSTNGIIGVIENLADAGFTASDAFEVFEVRAANAFVSLQGQRDSLRGIERDIQGTNAAVTASDTQMESLANTFANFQSIFGSMVQEAFEPFTRALQTVLEFVNTVMSGFQELDLVVATLGVVVGTVAVTQLIKFTQALLRKSQALTADTAATAANTGATNANAAANLRGATAAGRMAAAQAMLSRSIAFMGGPLGLAVAGGMTAITVFTSLAGSYETLAEKTDRAAAEFADASGAVEEQTSTIQALSDEIERMVQQEELLREGSDALASRTRTLEDRFRSLGLRLTDVAGDYDALLGRMKEFREEQTRVTRVLAEEEARAARANLNALETELRQDSLGAFNAGGNFAQTNELRQLVPGVDELLLQLQRRELPETVEVTRLLEDIYDELSTDEQDRVGDAITAVRDLEQRLRLRDSLEAQETDSERLARLARQGGERESEFFTNVLQSQGQANAVRNLLESAAFTQNPELQAQALGSGVNLNDPTLLAGLSDRARAGLEEAIAGLPPGMVENGVLVPLEEYFDGLEQTIMSEYENLPEAASELARENGVLGIVDRLFGTVTGVIQSAEERAAEAGASSFQLNLSRARRRLGVQRQILEDTRNDTEFNRAVPNFRNAVFDEARSRVGQRLNSDFNLTRDQINRLTGDISDPVFGRPGELASAIVEAADRMGIDLNSDRRRQLTTMAEEAGAQTADRLEAIVTQQAKITDAERRVSLQTQAREIEQMRSERDASLSNWPEGLELTRAIEAFADAEVSLAEIQAAERERLETEISAREITRAEAEARREELRLQQEQERTEAQRIEQQTLFRLWDAVMQREIETNNFRAQGLRNPQTFEFDAEETRREVDERYDEIRALQNQNLDLEIQRLERAVAVGEISKELYNAEVAKLQREAARANLDLEIERDETRRDARIESFSEIPNALRDRMGANNPDYFDSINNSMEMLSNTTLNSLLAGLNQAQSGFQRFFTDVASGAASVDDAFKSMAVGILQAMQQVITSKLAEMMMELIMNLAMPGSGGLGKIGGGKIGSKPKGIKFLKKSTGGAIPNIGIPTRDSVPILSQPGEFMLRKSAASAIGYDNLERINALGNRAISQSRPRPMPQPQPQQDNTVNVYAVLPEEKPVPGPKDIVAIITDDMRKGGTTKKLIKTINTGQM